MVFEFFELTNNYNKKYNYVILNNCPKNIRLYHIPNINDYNYGHLVCLEVEYC